MELNQSESQKILDNAPEVADFKLQETQNNKAPGYFKSIQTTADSSLYEDYQLRPFNPDDIYQKRGNYDLFDEMIQDDQISALLAVKKFLILNSKWEILSEDETIKEFLEWNFHKRLPHLLETCLYNMLSALDFGFSLTEKVYSSELTKDFGQKIVLSELLTRPPHTFEFDQDKKGKIINIRQDTAMGWKDIKPDKFIHYMYQPGFDNPYGNSELNIGVYKAWWSKNAVIKFWNIYLERFGMPTAIGTFPRDQAGERDNLKNALKNLQAKTSIVVPEGINIDFLTKESSTQSEYEAAIDKYNTLIARKMLVPDLAGLSGSETGGGSFALGKSQFDMMYKNIDHETMRLTRAINKELIDPLLKWNFGVNAEAEFKFDKTDTERKKADMTMWLEAVKTGKIPVTDEHVNWFLGEVNAPEIDQADLDKINEEKEAMKESLMNPASDQKEEKPENPGKEKVEEKKNPKVEDEKPKENKFTQDGDYYRPLTDHEKKIDFAKIERETSGIEAKYLPQLGDGYKLSINALVNDVKVKKIIERKRIDLINKLQLKHRDKLLKIYKNMLEDSYKSGKGSKVKSSFIITPDDGLNDNDIATWIKEHAIYTETEEAQNILKLSKATLDGGIRKGSGTREITKMLDEALKGYDLATAKDKAAGVKINRGQRLETITRTVTAKGYNEARKQDFQEIGDEIKAYQFSAILDGRTSKICRKLDKKIFNPEDLSYYTPPIHFNCRSVIVPIFNDEDFEGINKRGSDPGDIPPTEMRAGGFLVLNEDIKP